MEDKNICGDQGDLWIIFLDVKITRYSDRQIVFKFFPLNSNMGGFYSIKIHQ